MFAVSHGPFMTKIMMMVDGVLFTPATKKLGVNTPILMVKQCTWNAAGILRKGATEQWHLTQKGAALKAFWRTSAGFPKNSQEQGHSH